MEAHKAAHRISRYSASFASHQLMSFVIGLCLVVYLGNKGLQSEIGMLWGIIVATFIVILFDLPFMWKQMKSGTVEPERAQRYFSYGMPISISLILTYALSSIIWPIAVWTYCLSGSVWP